MSDQGEPAIKETKELQPIKHDCSRGQRGDKTSLSPAAPYRPPKETGEEERGHWRFTEPQHGQKMSASQHLNKLSLVQTV